MADTNPDRKPSEPKKPETTPSSELDHRSGLADPAANPSQLAKTQAEQVPPPEKQRPRAAEGDSHETHPRRAAGR
jgi:hypothetical protein